MTEFQNLEAALRSLKKNVSEFPIGAVSLDDFRPTHEKIKIMRDSLKHLNARLLTLKAQKESQMTTELPEEDDEKTTENLHEATANALINEKAIKLCLHSKAVHAILSGQEGDPEIRKKICVAMRKLFALNDDTISVQNSIESAVQKQLDAKIQCQNALFEYKNFLKEQEILRSKRLLETNPEIARTKEKMNKTLQRINIMKKLIRTFIAASGHMLMKEPILVKMLEDHRQLVTMETIMKMSQSTQENET